MALDSIGLLANHLPARGGASMENGTLSAAKSITTLRPLRSPWIFSAHSAFMTCSRYLHQGHSSAVKEPAEDPNLLA
jgi:hypothetical protein